MGGDNPFGMKKIKKKNTKNHVFGDQKEIRFVALEREGVSEREIEREREGEREGTLRSKQCN